MASFTPIKPEKQANDPNVRNKAALRKWTALQAGELLERSFAIERPQLLARLHAPAEQAAPLQPVVERSYHEAPVAEAAAINPDLIADEGFLSTEEAREKVNDAYIRFLTEDERSNNGFVA